jgi:SAM-dependent methyltransferase
VPAADRDASLADIDRLNAWFGGYRLTLRALGALDAGGPPPVPRESRRPARTGAGRHVGRPARGDAPPPPLRVSDVGGGRGDFARRALRWGRARGREVRVVVVDRDAGLLAGAVAGSHGRIHAVRADATALPFREGAVDVATASLTLHHLEPEAAALCLGQMRAAARGGVIVNDLWRAPLSLALVWIGTRLFARHRFSRHDGPLSVRRAYSPAELHALAARAGIGALAVRRYPWLGRLLAIAT